MVCFDCLSFEPFMCIFIYFHLYKNRCMSYCTCLSFRFFQGGTFKFSLTTCVTCRFAVFSEIRAAVIKPTVEKKIESDSILFTE